MDEERFIFSGIIHPKIDEYDKNYFGFGLRTDELPKVAEKFKGKPLLVDHHRSSPDGEIMEQDKCGIIDDSWIDENTGNLMGLFSVDLKTKKGRDAMNDIVNEKKLSLSFGSLAIVVDPDHDKEVKTNPIKVVEFEKLEEVSLCKNPAIKGSKIKSIHHYRNGDLYHQRIYNSLEKQKEKMSDLVRDTAPPATEAATATQPPMFQKGIETAVETIQSGKVKDQEMEDLKNQLAQIKKEKDDILAERKKEKEEQEAAQKLAQMEQNRKVNEKSVEKIRRQIAKLAELFKAAGQMEDYENLMKHEAPTLEEIATTGSAQSAEGRQVVTTLAAFSEEISESSFTSRERELRKENEKRAALEKETNKRVETALAAKDEIIAKKDEAINKAAANMLPNQAKSLFKSMNGGDSTTTTTTTKTEAAPATTAAPVNRVDAPLQKNGLPSVYKMEGGKRIRALASAELAEIDPAFEALPRYAKWASNHPDLWETCITSESDFKVNLTPGLKEMIRQKNSR